MLQRFDGWSQDHRRGCIFLSSSLSRHRTGGAVASDIRAAADIGCPLAALLLLQHSDDLLAGEPARFISPASGLKSPSGK